MQLPKTLRRSRRAAALTAHIDHVPPRRRRIGILTTLFAIVVLTGTCFRALAIDSYEAVYLYNSQGTPVLCTTDVYDEGHIYQISPYAEVGTVNSDGHIVSDSTGQIIGLIDPSQAAANELGH